MKKDKYLSKEYTNCLKGICAVVVVIHHLYQETSLFKGTYAGLILELSGALSVSVFFFFSGYGLMFSSVKKNYVQSFFNNKFLPLYFFNVILVIFYSLWTLLLENTFLFQQFVQSFFFGNTVVINGWYLQATFVLYLMYLFSFSIFKSAKTQIVAVAIGVLIYCIFCRFIGLGFWWYHTIPCVVLGMVCCYKKDRIDALLNKYVKEIFIISAMLFVISYIIISFCFKEPMLNIIYLLLYVCATISLSYILCSTPIINNPFFALCGKYSLEIYVSHGFFLRLIKLNIFNNEFLYILTVIVGTIVTSIFMKMIYTRFIPCILKKCHISH